MKEYEERKQWFIDRIGKRVYRDATSCKCPICKSGGEHGVFINDKLHALYLQDCEFDLEIKYRDKK